MNDLHIKYDSGSMVIHMDNFFPTSQQTLKKLLKIIELDWQHETELKEKLKVYFQNKVAEHESLKQKAGKSHLMWRQKVADTSVLVATKKKPIGIGLSKDELKKAKEDLRYYKAMAKETLSDFNRHNRIKEQFIKHIELM